MPFLASTQTIHHTNTPSAYRHGYRTPELSVSPLSLTHTFVFSSLTGASPSITSATAPHPENLPFSHTTVFQALTLPSSSTEHAQAHLSAHPAWTVIGFRHSSTLDFCWPCEIPAFQSSITHHPHCHHFLFSFCSRFRELCSRKLQNHRNSLSTNLWMYASEQLQQEPGAAGTSCQSHPVGLFLEPQRGGPGPSLFLAFQSLPSPWPLQPVSQFRLLKIAVSWYKNTPNFHIPCWISFLPLVKDSAFPLLRGVPSFLAY